MYIINEKAYRCPVEITNDIFNDKWKLGIIWHLLDGEKRYKDLHEEVCAITQKTLTAKLKELEEKELIHRQAFAEIPPRVVYSLTPMGEALRPVLNAMHQWGIEYTKNHGTITDESGCSLK